MASAKNGKWWVEMKKALHFLDDNLEAIFISICMGYFVVVTILQVIFRFVLKIPAAWTEETARYAFIWMSYIGSAYATKKSTHIRVDVLDNYVGKTGKEVLWWVSQSLFLLFAIIITKTGIEMLVSLGSKPQTSPALKIPMQWVYACLPVGMGLTIVRLIQNFVIRIRSYAHKEDDQA